MQFSQIDRDNIYLPRHERFFGTLNSLALRKSKNIKAWQKDRFFERKNAQMLDNTREIWYNTHEAHKLTHKKSKGNNKMKKLLAAALAALMIFTFAACDEGDSEETTRAKKKKTTAPEVTTVDPEITTNLPGVTTDLPETTTAPVVTTTTSPVTVTPEVTTPETEQPSGLAQLLSNARDSVNNATGYVVKSTSKTVIEVSGEKVETVEYTTVTFRKVGDGFEAMIVVEYDNDEAVPAVAYYKDGMVYTSYEDTKVCYELSADDFRELAGLQEEQIDYSEIFSTFSVTGNEDGTTVIGATDFTAKGKDYIASIVGDLGDVEVAYPAFSIEVTVDHDGNMRSLAVNIVVEATSEGVTARVSMDSIQEFSDVNNVGSIDFPSFDGYEKIDNM